MKNKSMSRASIVVTSMMIVCVVLALGASAAAQSGDGGPGSGRCSNRTLFGDYGTQIEGTILGPNLPIRGLLMAHYDGKGNLTLVQHIVINGVPPAEEWAPGSGTYTVNPDCTGTAVITTANPPIPLHFVVVNHGKEIHQVVDGDAITAVAYRVD